MFCLNRLVLPARRQRRPKLVRLVAEHVLDVGDRMAGRAHSLPEPMANTWLEIVGARGPVRRTGVMSATYAERVELRHLRYFIAVATELHYARAAQRLFISQPALSQQIRNLESELGLKLLQRNRREVRLTPEGDAFFVEAIAVVEQADHALEVARALAEGATGHLRMSYVLTTPGGLPELIVSEYQRRYPDMQISANSGSTAQNFERLRRGELDVAFVHNPLEDDADLGWIEITTQPLMVAVPSTHPLSRRRRLHREHLACVPLVYIPRRNSPGVYDSILAQVYGSRPPEILRTEPTMERVLVAVSEGVGVTLLLEERAAMLRRPGVTFRRFADPEPTVALGVAFRRPPSMAAQKFIDLAQALRHQHGLADRPRV
jgi:DNA-binding transcriptional LysR family regulator